MRQPLRTALFITALTAITPSARAFDKDFAINDINLNEENFLDIKAHRFRKSLEYAWYDSNSAWRITSASLDQDLAFVQTELKLQQELSDYVNIRLDMAQEIFYADKELPLPSTELEIFPWAGDIGFSVLGTPTYDKRDLDLGAAVTWGRRPWNYTRFEYVDTDMLYNQKNVSDNTYYSTNPRIMKLEGAYQFAEHYKLRFHLKRETPLERIDPDIDGLFKYEASDYFLLFDYQPAADSVIGITLNGFTLDKSRSETGQNQLQATDYISADVYWVQGMGRQYELRLGTQYDEISNDIRDLVTASNNLDYSMKTLQLYATAYHPFNEHMAWDLGFYIGHAKEEQNYLQDPDRNTLNDDVQAKFRMGFEYSSADGRSALQFNVSLNVDALFSDPGDGGGISFQTVF